jgi:hypothetical protein
MVKKWLVTYFLITMRLLRAATHMLLRPAINYIKEHTMGLAAGLPLAPWLDTILPPRCCPLAK